MAHEGWKNYETWAVALWIDNDRQALDDWTRAARETLGDYETDAERTAELADALKDSFEATQEALELGDGPWADLLNAAMGEVDWDELAEHYLEKAVEQTARE